MTRPKTWFASERVPRVIAHRGLALEAPENTMLSFCKAMSIGVTHLETDAQATRDGIAVLSHDPDLVRSAGIDRPVESYTYAELRAVALPQKQQVPSLAEALDGFPDAFFNIDIKAEAALRPVVETVRRLRAVDRVLVTSFDDARRKKAVAQLPGVATSPSSSGVIAAALASRLPSSVFGRVHRAALADVDALQVPERFRGIPLVTPALVKVAHRNGVEVHVWTVNDPADMRRLLAMGVDGLITDRADLALAVVRDRAG